MIREKPIIFNSSYDNYTYTIKTEYIPPYMDQINFVWSLIVHGFNDNNAIKVGAVYSKITPGKIATLTENLNGYLGVKNAEGFANRIIEDIEILKEANYSS